MTDFMAVAAVTARIRSLLFHSLQSDVSGVEVTTRPPDKARENLDGKAQVNLFLYHIMPDAAWRNMDSPQRVRSGEKSYPLLPLKLYYLLTAYYGSADEGIDSVTNKDKILGSLRLLGRAMSVLHDNPILDADSINELLPRDDKSNHPYNQVENVRITLQPISQEEMSKLWNTFQTNYRTSAAYEVSAVLMESDNVGRAAPPVLSRGENDAGVSSMASPSPVLYGVSPPEPQPSVRLGEELVFRGDYLDAGKIILRFSNPHLTEPIEMAPQPGSGRRNIIVRLPDGIGDLVKWAAGFYTVSAVVKQKGMHSWTTNEVPFALAPSIKVDPQTANPGDITLTINCSPWLKEGQKVYLLFGDRQFQSSRISGSIDSLKFSIPKVDPGEYLVRLRVDGVDSLPIIRTGSPERIAFDVGQKVMVKESTP